MSAPALAAVLLALAARGEWQLVRGPGAGIGPLTWERIGEVYLRGRAWRAVDPSDAARAPAASRLVAGSLADDAHVRAIAAELGLEPSGSGLALAGRELPAGAGFAAEVADPDGGGVLLLLCGADDASAQECFRATLDVEHGSWAALRGGAVVERGRFALAVRADEPAVVRLDLALERLLAEGADLAPGERALHAARGLVGFGDVLQRLGAGRDLLPFVARLAAEGSSLELARGLALERDLDAAVRDAWRTCARALGPPPSPAPVYYLAVGDERSTNAQTFGVDPLTGRPRIALNLAALARGRHLEAALVHETAHAFHFFGGGRGPERGDRLADRALVEGVATLLAQRLVDDLGDADALLWSAEELAAAAARRGELTAAFRADASSTDPARHAPWLVLGVANDRVAGAPSRSGYYVAWLAARAWMDADPARGPADLLDASADDVLAALR